MARFDKRRLIGRTIVDVRLNPFSANRAGERGGGTAHDPEIVLDNGAVLRFVTEETETGGYGTRLVLHRPEKRAQP